MGDVEMSDTITIKARFIPNTSWYKPQVPKNSPHERDRQAQKRRKIGFVARRIRQNPRIKEAFGKGKPKTERKTRQRKQREHKPEHKPRQPKQRQQHRIEIKPTTEKAHSEGFNRLVEKAYVQSTL